MGIGIGVFFLALGAILYWAVNGEVQGVDLDAVGIILMVAGGVSLLWGLLASAAMPWRRDTVVHDDIRYRDRV